MKKRLIFSFYTYSGWQNNFVNDYHFELLARYAHIFDEAIICLNVDKNGTFEDKLTVKVKFTEIFGGKPIVFREYENTSLRESNIFYNEIALKLQQLDGYTFFAHNKGITEADKGEEIIQWICGLYYFSLENIEDVFDAFHNRKLSYGSFPQISPWNETSWFYAGTFFWVNASNIYNYMKFNSIELPLLGDRWYDEFFLGKIFDVESYLWQSLSYYMPNYNIVETLYKPINEKTKESYPSQYNDFKEFCNCLINKVNKVSFIG